MVKKSYLICRLESSFCPSYNFFCILKIFCTIKTLSLLLVTCSSVNIYNPDYSEQSQKIRNLSYRDFLLICSCFFAISNPFTDLRRISFVGIFIDKESLQHPDWICLIRRLTAIKPISEMGLLKYFGNGISSNRIKEISSGTLSLSSWIALKAPIVRDDKNLLSLSEL